jgi:hypothetical protein
LSIRYLSQLVTGGKNEEFEVYGEFVARNEDWWR